MALTPAHEELLTEAEAVGRDLAGRSGRRHDGRLDRSLVTALGESGLLGRLYPPGGLAATELCLIRHGLARADTAAETAFALQGLGSYPIHRSAPPDVAERWIPGVRNGSVVPAFALSEQGAGSDAAALELAAEPDGEGWRLTGQKTWISNAPDADVYVVFARTTPGARSRGVSAFLVPGGSPGLTGEPLEMMSPHPIGSLTFDGVAVPGHHLLGTLDRGFEVAMATLDLFRPSVGAMAVGIAEAALRLATAHAESRQAFGRPIADHQAIAHRLADIAAATTAARLLVYEAAATYDSGERERLPGLAAMAKLVATENAQQAVDGAVQILGARALETSHPLSHLYQEVRAPRIYEGTSEIQRSVIARELRAGRLG